MSFFWLLGGSVKAVEGPGNRKVSTSSDEDGTQTTRYYYVIGGYQFRVKRQGFLTFEDGLNYRAYYTTIRKALVNLEVLE